MHLYTVTFEIDGKEEQFVSMANNTWSAGELVKMHLIEFRPEASRTLLEVELGGDTRPLVKFSDLAVWGRENDMKYFRVTFDIEDGANGEADWGVARARKAETAAAMVEEVLQEQYGETALLTWIETADDGEEYLDLLTKLEVTDLSQWGWEVWV